MQRFFVQFGCAEQLKSADKWAAPPLEVWKKLHEHIEEQGRQLADEAQFDEAAQQQESAAARADTLDEESAATEGSGNNTEGGDEGGIDDTGIREETSDTPVECSLSC